MADVFFFRRDFTFSPSGEATVIAKGTPNLRKTHVKKKKKKIPCTYLVLLHKPIVPLK